MSQKILYQLLRIKIYLACPSQILLLPLHHTYRRLQETDTFIWALG